MEGRLDDIKKGLKEEGAVNSVDIEWLIKIIMDQQNDISYYRGLLDKIHNMSNMV